MPKNTNTTELTRDTSMQCTPATPSSSKGIWKMTRHGIHKKYMPSHPQNYGGELNEHYRSNHPPVLCPVCKKTFSCPNTTDRHLHLHNLNKQYACDKCKESFAFKHELATHKIRHRTIRTWICAKKGCDRDFKCNLWHMQRPTPARCLFAPSAITLAQKWKRI